MGEWKDVKMSRGMHYCPTSEFGKGFWYIIENEFGIFIEPDGTLDIRGFDGPYARKGGQPWRDSE